MAEESGQPVTTGTDADRVGVLLDERDLRTFYANAYRMHTSAEEVIIDLGFNMPNPNPNAPGGANRAYLTKSWRGTGGLRFAFSDRIVLKAEYLHNGEYGGIPQIKNDVFTTSLLLID